jgi:hypothetical protein
MLSVRHRVSWLFDGKSLLALIGESNWLCAASNLEIAVASDVFNGTFAHFALVIL